MQYKAQLQRLSRAFINGLQPPARLTVSQWAEQFRVMSSESSAQRGKWTTRPFQQEPMDCLSPSHPCQQVVLMCASQMMKTELILNFLGYIMHVDPGPALLVEPRVEDAKALSKDRVAPMIRDCPELRNRVSEAKGRDSDNTTLHKRFTGGHVTFTGAISPSGLAMRPIRFLLLDEVDRYPVSAGSEGDPVLLATRRTDEFYWNKKIILCSTPTIKGKSRIEKAFLQSDQRYPYVPCPHCGEFQVLHFDRLVWPENEPEKAAYRCSGCEASIPEFRKSWMLQQGQWRAQAESRIPGFWISKMYSTRTTWGDLAQEHLTAKRGGDELLKTFVNTALAQPWEERHEVKVDEHALMARRESWAAVPDEVAVITAGCDVQANRIEVEVVGWGRDEENWSLGYYVLAGDPAKPDIWNQLDEILQAQFETESGDKLPIRAACIDSGYATSAVYRFTQPRRSRKVFATKGRAGRHPVWPQKISRGQRGAALWLLGVDTAKDRVMACLKVEEPGPSYCHFPSDRELDYFEQLTAERIKVRYVNGFAQRTWEKEAGQRNEALDTRVNNIGALHALYQGGLNLNREADRRTARVADKKKPIEERAAVVNPLTPLLGMMKPIVSKDPWL